MLNIIGLNFAGILNFAINVTNSYFSPITYLVSKFSGVTIFTRGYHRNLTWPVKSQILAIYWLYSVIQILQCNTIVKLRWYYTVKCKFSAVQYSARLKSARLNSVYSVVYTSNS